MPPTPPVQPRSPAAPQWLKSSVAGVVLAAMAATAGWVWWQREQAAQAAAQAREAQQARERGRLLFEQGDGLPGRMAGHSTDLPPLASRCSNCHARQSTAGAAPAGPPAVLPQGPAPAPALGGDRLTTLQPRRGGPPSRFDAAALCQLLATGRDPAQVVVNVAMPRYAATAAQCQDLWTFLTAAP